MFKPIESLIGYTFKSPALLQRALTHSSYSRSCNEQLECVGDAVLSLIILEHIHLAFPHYTEGQLQRIKSSVVCNANLARIALAHDLGMYLSLGASELGSGGRTKPSILADALEAIIGAIYLDSGLEAARKFIMSFF